MDGFEQLLSDAILKKKVPVVLVNERQQADFLISGAAHVKEPGWLKSWVISTHGKAHISITDAHTGSVVLACTFTKVDQMTADYYIYQGWANSCAKHLKKALENK